MNLVFRLLALLLSAPFRASIIPPLGVSRLRFRVWPHDLDTNLHMNNGRYLTIADLGRTDLLLRSGLWRAVLKQGWMPMLSGASIRFRRELKPFQPFTLESRILCWRDTVFVMEHRFITQSSTGEAVTAAIALVRGGLYHRASRAFVPVETLLAVVGHEGPSPEIEPEVETFLALEEALKRR